MIALREAGKPTKVKKEHFLKALEKVEPSVSKEDLERYERIKEEFKKILS